LNSTIGPTPLQRIGQAPKALLAYRTETPFSKAKSRRPIMPDGQPALVECLTTGQQFVAFGTHPDTRQPYRWPQASPLHVPLAALPVATEVHVLTFVAEAEHLLRASGGYPEGNELPDSTSPRSPAQRPAGDWVPPTREEVAEALSAVPNDNDCTHG